jgi:hypothetical protein
MKTQTKIDADDALTYERQLSDELHWASNGTFSPDYLFATRDRSLQDYLDADPKRYDAHKIALDEASPFEICDYF